MQNKLIQLTDVDFSYGSQPALRGVTLDVAEGDLMGVIGPNGGGKTTLVKLILGLLKPSRGCIAYRDNGKKVKNISIGYMPQEKSIDKKFPISVRQVVSSGLIERNAIDFISRSQKSETVESTIEKLGLSTLIERHIGELSGGQLQRALLARAIVSSPKLLLLDEPNTYLDKFFEEQLYNILDDLNKQCTIIVVSHDIGTILQNVKSVTCVNTKVDHHPVCEVSQRWIEKSMGCPIEILGHGDMPHRVLKMHNHNCPVEEGSRS